ncbi:hypothetical protein AYO21_09213 [Fonsecaea monophora]|uniref:Heterokaryon incompatibility domain-containing protein n=1 Tax=Fonsecaea monophora TaxID=254056 RepID=A0A177EY78_9EURO|nr:hypothetical protein AYO21_09213 [Fonsecaea monophora]OAG36556.1 hypothetical protein AYO21_09213 [Fonsecaea monophora]
MADIHRRMLVSWRKWSHSRTSVQSALSPLELEVVNAIYSPLDHDLEEIRLVELQPSARIDAEIVCTLKVVSFGQRVPDYEGLSYAWGDPRSVDFVKLNGVLTPITTNLAAALRHLRKPSEARVLWIDALSINQSDNRERAHQVKTMKKIYQNAQATRIWLGLAGPENDLAFDFFIYIALAMRERTFADTMPTFLQEGMKHLLQFKELFQRSWWSRVWVLQEAILGPVAFLHSGHRQIPLHQMLDAYNFLRSSGENGLLRLARQIINVQHLSDLVACMRQSLDLIEDLRSFYLHTDPAQDSKEVTWKWTTWNPPSKPEILIGFIELLAKCRRSYATDARDKIYGLLGLAPTEVTQELEPTYEISAEVLFTETAVKLIESSNSLLLFGQISPHKLRGRKTALPTWVPDWDSPGSHCADIELRIKQEKLFNACNSEELKSARVHDFGLALMGVCVGEISDSTKAMPPHCEHKDAPDRFSDWEKFSTGGSTWVWDDKVKSSFSETYWRTILNGAVPDDSGFNLRKVQNEDLDEFLQWRHENKWVAGTEHDFVLLHGRHKWNEHISRTTGGRRLFRTRYGDLGLGPAGIKSGDLIFVLAGGSHPCILRPSKLHERLYTLVGECYVDHLMYGYGVRNPTAEWRCSMPRHPVWRRWSRHASRSGWVRTITLNRSRNYAKNIRMEHSMPWIHERDSNNYWQTIVLC